MLVILGVGTAVATRADIVVHETRETGIRLLHMCPQMCTGVFGEFD